MGRDEERFDTGLPPRTVGTEVEAMLHSAATATVLVLESVTTVAQDSQAPRGLWRCVATGDLVESNRIVAWRARRYPNTAAGRIEADYRAAVRDYSATRLDAARRGAELAAACGSPDAQIVPDVGIRYDLRVVLHGTGGGQPWAVILTDVAGDLVVATSGDISSIEAQAAVAYMDDCKDELIAWRRSWAEAEGYRDRASSLLRDYFDATGVRL